MMMAHADGGEWVTARPGATLEEKRLLSAGFTNVVPNLTFELTLSQILRRVGASSFSHQQENLAPLSRQLRTHRTSSLCGARAPARGKPHDGHDALSHQERNAQVRRARL
jgi:hypothetical protein